YGIILFTQERFNEAREAFQKALDINPYYAKAHPNLGIMLEGEGKLEEAANHYRQAIDNEPGYRLAHFHLGRILVNQGRNREAIAHFQGILEPEDKETPGYLYALAIASIRAGDRSTGLSHLQEARQTAASFGQSELVAMIEKDLRTLQGGR
ncbi:MAG: tetratricopeptide repeat protein, partial [bacterium]|nr:tetratricopeptide repeat protein [bacterium]